FSRTPRPCPRPGPSSGPRLCFFHGGGGFAGAYVWATARSGGASSSGTRSHQPRLGEERRRKPPHPRTSAPHSGGFALRGAGGGRRGPDCDCEPGSGTAGGGQLRVGGHLASG